MSNEHLQEKKNRPVKGQKSNVLKNEGLMKNRRFTADIPDNAKSICQNAEFVGVTEMSVHI